MTDVIETINYRGIDIDVVSDIDAPNPFLDWDCNPDLIVVSPGGSSNRTQCSIYGDTSFDRLPDLTEEQIVSALRNPDTATALKEYDRTTDSMLTKALEHWVAYGPDAEEVNNTLQNAYEELHPALKLDLLSLVLTMQGIVNLNTSVQGFSQSDYAEVLVVATKEWCDRVGVEVEKPADLQPYADLYQQWAYGEVYGYVIDELDDSCFGFFGDYDKDSYMLDQAKEIIDYHLKLREESRIKKLKEMIRNHVPLQYRERYQSAGGKND